MLAHAGDGKTVFLMQLLKGAAQAGFHSQGYFFEDPKDKLSDRVIAAEMGVSAFHLRRLAVEGSADEIQKRLEAAKKSLAWAERVITDDRVMEVDELIKTIRARHVPGKTKVVGVDYAQAFDAEHDERSVERVVSRLAWKLNEYAKECGVAVVLLSQVRRDVLDRGRRWYESWRWKNQGGPVDAVAVEGFRPLEGDMQWSSAIQHRARQVLSIFRPGAWLKSLGYNVPDNTMEAQLLKGNYGPGKGRIVLDFDGPTASIRGQKANG